MPDIIPSEKSYATAVCLSGIFGILGIHHFYLGRYLMGIIDLTFSFLALYFFLTGRWMMALFLISVDYIHTVIITIVLLVGAYKDGDGRLVTYPGQTLK